MSYQIILTVQATHDHRSLPLDEALRVAERLTEAIESKVTDGGKGQHNKVVAVSVEPQ